MTRPYPPLFKILGLVLALGGTLAFLLLTPAGVLRKADYIGAVACHRRPAHSFFIDGQQLPVCQRCSGTFPGALTGILVHWALCRRRRSFRFPPLGIALVFGGFAALWALDGLNSATSEMPLRLLVRFLGERSPGVGVLGYAPQPWLRLVSGVLMGSAMSALLVPAFNQTLWADGEELPALRSWGELGLLVGVELAVAGLILWMEPFLLYPVALYSVAGIVVMFVLLGAMLFVMATGRDNSMVAWRESWVPLLWGIVFALLLIGAIDLVRVRWLGTIDGVPGLP